MPIVGVVVVTVAGGTGTAESAGGGPSLVARTNAAGESEWIGDPDVPWWDPGADTSVSPETDHVLVAGYANAYIHYVTTPEEYAEQRYEGGSTLFGRWEAPALTQIAVELATAMRPSSLLKSGSGIPMPSSLCCLANRI